MSTRFSADSSTEIWDHLNALDQDRIDSHAKIPYAMAAGASTVTIAAGSAGSGSTGTVVFPAGRFTRAPMVTGQVVTNSGSGWAITLFIWGVHAGGFTFRVTPIVTFASSVAIEVHWHAVQMSSSAAAG